MAFHLLFPYVRGTKVWRALNEAAAPRVTGCSSRLSHIQADGTGTHTSVQAFSLDGGPKRGETDVVKSVPGLV